jgi:hypothetical protein
MELAMARAWQAVSMGLAISMNEKKNLNGFGCLRNCAK